ncbi:MAG: leucine-rich repeat protein [Clostridia bacterium]|nr:leucine-rich repeat protein [Clostridia bacterium]
MPETRFKTMKKRLLVILVMAAVLCTSLPVWASAEEVSGVCGADGDNLTWTLDDAGTLTISGAGALTAKYDQYNHNQLVQPWAQKHLMSYNNGQIWVYTYDHIKEVVLGEGITEISGPVFSGHTGLTHIELPESVTTIGDNTFSGCTGLRSVSLPSGITNIGNGTFSGCTELTDIAIPKQVTAIGNETFQDCSSLRSINIPDGVKSIGDYAFENCTALTSVTIPNGVTTIGKYAFSCCESLNEAALPESISKIGKGAFLGCINLSAVTTPKGVTVIESLTFKNCTGLTSVTLPESLTEIGIEAFRDCTGLTRIVIPKNVSYIEDSAFSGCVNLVDIPLTGIICYPHIVTKGTSQQLYITLRPSVTTEKDTTLSYNILKKGVGGIPYASISDDGIITGQWPGHTSLDINTENLTETFDIQVQIEKNGDYINYGYPFVNTRESFGYKKDNHLPVLRYQQAGLSYPKAKLFSSMYKWDGGCYGMAVSSMLFYKGKLDPTDYDKTAKYPYYFPSQIGDDAHKKLREMIELFHLSQYTYLKDWDIAWKLFSFAESLRADEMARQMDSGYPVLLWLKAEHLKEFWIEHTIVLYGYEKTDSGYTFYAYDPSDEIASVDISEDGVSIFYSASDHHDFKVHAYASYYSVENIYTSLAKKNKKDAAALLSSAEEAGDYTYCIVPASEFTVTDADGRSAALKDGELIGDIPDIHLLLPGDRAETPVYTLLMPAGEYTFDGVGSVNMANDELFISVSAKEGPVTVSDDLRSIDLRGDFEVTYTAEGNDYDSLKLTGSAASGVALSLREDMSRADVRGADTIRAAVTVGGQESSVSSEVGASDACVVLNAAADEKAALQILAGGETVTDAVPLSQRQKTEKPVPEIIKASSGPWTLTFDQSDPEAVIYYTTDGTEPDEDNGHVYIGPIEINRPMTIQAAAVKEGYLISDIVSLDVPPFLSAPTCVTPQGISDEPVTVELTAEEGAKIYYTLDGSDPAIEGIEYYGPFTLWTSATLKACCEKDGCFSETAEFRFLIGESGHIYASVEKSSDGTVLKYSATVLEDDAQLLIARFHGANMEDCTFLPPRSGVLPAESGYIYKLFLINADCIPLCESVMLAS